jgi:penicillin amidase
VLRARWLLTAVLMAVAAIVLVCWGGTLWLRHAMRTSLPQVDGTLHVAALSQPVTVRRDAHGVPHITAANMDDLLVAQGYVTAQDRLWQLDMLRRFASGNLAEILGPRAIEHDRAQRILEIGRAADAALAAMDPADRHSLEDYARGVNAYMAQTQDHLPAEFRLLHYRPAPWQPRDSVLVAMNLVQTLSVDFPTKLTRGSSAHLNNAGYYRATSDSANPAGFLADKRSPQRGGSAAVAATAAVHTNSGVPRLCAGV